MPGKVVGKSLNLGFIGNVSRNPMNMIIARTVMSILDAGVETLQPIPFGKATVLNVDGTVSLFGDSGAGVSLPTDANFAGFAVAEVKQATIFGTNQVGEYPNTHKCDVLQFGSLTVALNETVTSIDAGSQVYIVDNAGTAIDVFVGDIVKAVAPSGDSTAIALTGVKFKTGKIDANNVVEITLESRVNV